MSSLFEIDAGILELLENGYNMACVNPETGEIDETAAATYLQELQLDREVKLDNYGKYIKNLDAEISALKAQEQAFNARRKAKEKKAETLKSAVLASLQNCNQKKFETVNVSYSLRRSEIVEVSDIENLDPKYIRETIKVEPNKTEIKAALKRGESVEGAVLVEKNNLQIK